MSFLDINGLAIDVDADAFDRTYADVQTFNRSEGLSYEGTFYAPKREWGFSIPWQPRQAESIAVRDWIKGRGHYWQFQRFDGSTIRFNKYASDGGPGFNSNIAAGTTRFTNVSPSGALWGGLVTSNQTSTVTVTFGSEGRWSISVWKNLPTSTWVLASVVFDGTNTVFYAPGAAVTTTFSNWMTISAVSGFLSVGLRGKDQQGNNDSAAAYDKLWIVPYALSTSMLTARQARTVAAQFEPVFPFVEMDGDCLEDLYPVTVKGFVPTEEMLQVSHASTIANARMLKVDLIER